MACETIDESVKKLCEDAGESFGIEVLELQAEHLLPLVTLLKREGGFDLLLDVTAVDYPDREPRFDVVYHLYGSGHNRRLRLKVRVPESLPTVPTLTPLYGSAGYAERETHEMYGIEFAGNADLRPILLYEGFEGHPLRKDYALDAEQPIVAYRK